MSLPARSRLLVLYMSFLHSLNHSLHNSISTLSLSIVLEGFTYQEIGSAYSISMLLFGLGALVCGHIAVRLADRRGILLSILMQGASCALVMINGVWGLFLFLASYGLFGSFYHPLSNSYIVGRFEANAGEAMGLHGLGGNIGIVVYPAVAGLLALAFGWRYTVLLFGLLIIMASIPTLWFPANPTRYQAPKAESYLRTLFNRYFALTVIFNMIVILYYRGAELYLTPYLNNVKGFDPVLAILGTSVALTGGILGQYLGGRIGDSRGPEAVILASSAVGMLAISGLRVTTFFILELLWIFLMGLSYYSLQPAVNLFQARKFRKETLAVVYGLWFSINFTMVSASSLIAGFVVQQYGFDALYGLASVMSVPSVLVAFYVYRNERRSR